MNTAASLPPPEKRQSIKIAEVAKTNARDLWDRAARIALPIGACGGFCSDVLAPLGPVTAYLAFGATFLCAVSGVIWYGIKKRQIRHALADGNIDADEFHHITSTSTWPTIFAFTLISSIVLLLFFGAQKVFAGDEPEKGLMANTFPFIQQLQQQVLKLQQSADRIEKSADRIEAGNADIKKALAGLNEKLDGLNQRLASMDKNTAAIGKPATPEDYYFNARLYELRGEAVKARQSYVEYMKGNLPYLDPHLALSALMKLQDGPAAAREAYSTFLNGTETAPLLARALMLDREARITALEQLAKDSPEYAPVFFYLSRDYSAPEQGQQTLDNLKRERESLEKFKALSDRGLFTKYFIDKRMAVSLESDGNTRMRKFATMSDAYLSARAKMTILPREDGWEGVVTVPYDAAEILVRLPGQKDFKSLGLSSVKSASTGQPTPNTALTMKNVSKGTVEIKYKDNQGKEFGPFPVEFDPAKEFVALAKKMMPSAPSELAPVSMWKGKKSVTLVQLLMFRAAVASAVIGPDAETLNHKLKLGKASAYRVYEIQPDDPLVSQDVPSAWKNVFLKLTYVDGSVSEPMQLQ